MISWCQRWGTEWRVAWQPLPEGWPQSSRRPPSATKRRNILLPVQTQRQELLLLQLYSHITDGCQDYEKLWSTQFLWRHVLSVNDSGQSILLPLTFVLIIRGRGSSSSGVTRIRMMLRKFHRVLLRVFISGSALTDCPSWRFMLFSGAPTAFRSHGFMFISGTQSFQTWSIIADNLWTNTHIEDKQTAFNLWVF